MAADLILAPEAEQDIADAYAWYEIQGIGLGERILSYVDACINSIQRRPESRPVIFKQYRRGLVRRFPYAVFYEYAVNTVTVYCVFHTSRDPNKWQQRL